MKEQMKQIEELAEDILQEYTNCYSEVDKEVLVKMIYNAGYRKQKEGEWIPNKLIGYAYAFYCSECGWVDGYPFNDRHKYCPNCGAKMKGGEADA